MTCAYTVSLSSPIITRVVISVQESNQGSWVSRVTSSTTPKISVKADPFVFAHTLSNNCTCLGVTGTLFVQSRLEGVGQPVGIALEQFQALKVMVLVSSAFLRLVSRFVCRTNWAS